MSIANTLERVECVESESSDNTYLFPRQARLTTPSDFKSVFDGAQIKLSSQHLLILARRQTSRARLGMVVAKKNIKTSVGRNRAKRHIRETYRHQQQLLSGLDIVVLVRKGFGELADGEMNTLLNKQWQRLQKKLIA